MNTIETAKQVVKHWDEHERFRTIEEDRLLFSNGDEPDDVAIARALIRYQQANEQMRVALMAVLENEEASKGFNGGNLDTEMEAMIRDAVTWRI